MAYVKYDWEKMEEMKLSGTHQGGLKALGVGQGQGPRVRSFQKTSVTPQRGKKKHKRYK